MLKQATAIYKLEDKETEIEISEVYNKYDANLKAGGTMKLELLTYSPLFKKFQFQAPTAIKPVAAISKVLGLELKVKDVLASWLIDITTKVLAKVNNNDTTVSIASLRNMRNSNIKVAFVTDDKKIEYYDIVRIYDPVEEAAKSKATKLKLASNETQFELVKMETRDGSLFVINHLIMK